MKIVEGKGRQWTGRLVIAISVVVLGLVVATGVPVWASSAAEHAEGGWEITDWYRVMNFVVLVVGLYWLLRKPVAQALNGRINRIAGELEELESRKKAAEIQLAEYEQQLAALDKEAERIIEEYQRQGQEAKARILREAEATAEKLKEQARKNIEHEFKQARLTLQQEIVEKALARAEQLIAEKISAEDQDRLVDEYLDKVVA
jgi:F-type H+-transporting ATPase subunit b